MSVRSKNNLEIARQLKDLLVTEAVIIGTWYLIASVDCSDNYHYNDHGMGSKLWTFGIDYKFRIHKALVEQTVIKALSYKNAKRGSDAYKFFTELSNVALYDCVRFSDELLNNPFIWK